MNLNINLFTSSHSMVEDSIKRDSSNIEVRYFEEDIRKRFSGDEFDYSINDSGGVNLIQRVLQKFFGWMNDLFGIDLSFLDYQTLELIIYGLMAIGALYLILKFLLQAPLNTVFRNEAKEVDGFNYVEEDISEVNFDGLIDKAIAEGNYRLATRFLYLKALKSLAGKQIIDWHYDKTNSEYLNEISNNEIKNLFKRISYIYDYVWYGEFAIDKAMYDKNKLDFSKLTER